MRMATYLWGNKPIWADLAASFNWIGIVTARDPAVLDNSSSPKNLKETTETLPSIAEWLKERHETAF